MDKTKKILLIIFLTLSIISMTFGLCKKVGLCADSTENMLQIDPYPYLYKNNIGYDDTYNENTVLQIIDDAIQRAGTAGVNVLVYYTTNSSGYIYCVNILTSNTFDFPSDAYIGSGSYALTTTSRSYTYTLNGNYITNPSNNHYIIPYYIYYHAPNDKYYYLQNEKCGNYPLYIRYPDLLVNNDGVQIFSDGNSNVDIPSGHSKGGNISNYVPVDDSNVDVSNVSPSSSNTTNFLQSITNLLQNLTKSTQNGFSNIVSNLQNFWNPILGWLEQTFDSLLDKIDSVIAFLTPPSISDITSAWISYYNNSALAKFGDLFSSLNDIFIQIFNASAPDTLSFTYNLPSFSLSNGFGDSYIMGRTITIDFGWYNNVRDTFISILAPLLYLSFFYMLFIKIPGIIGGSSGPVQSLVNTGKSKSK